MSESTEASTSAPSLQISVKGPQDIKLSISVPSTATVLELKGIISEANSTFPSDSQRLIYSGRVLKDEELISKYGLKDGHTIHLVKGARAANPQPSGGSSAAVGVPQNFAAGQQIAGNPLAPLLNAQNAGALAGFNPFAQMDVNPNDPNYALNMMQDPAVQANMANLLSDPAVIDQLIASSPELSAMGPNVRQLMQSEHFRSFLTDPNAMRMMMGGMGGAAGAPGSGFPPPGAFGWGSGAGGNGGAGAGAGAPGAGAALFNPWASTPTTAATPTSPSATPGEANQATPSSPPAAGNPGAFNPFAMLGGGAGGVGGRPGAEGMNMQQMMADLQRYRANANMGGAGGGGGMFGGMGGMESPTGGSAPTGPVQSPEERYQTQLEQLSNMGFHDGARNVRALMASGGSVEGAIEWLFSN